jgi:hypothetical protein
MCLSAFVRFVDEGHSRRAARRISECPFPLSSTGECLSCAGSLAPRPSGGRRHAKLEPHRAFHLEKVAEKADITIPELAERAAATCEKANPASLSRWLIRIGHRVKTYGSRRSQEGLPRTICVNVSGLGGFPSRPRWRYARSGPRAVRLLSCLVVTLSQIPWLARRFECDRPSLSAALGIPAAANRCPRLSADQATRASLLARAVTYVTVGPDHQTRLCPWTKRRVALGHIGSAARLPQLHRFLNFGKRFSVKARMPSFWSSVANSEWKMRRSKRTPSASVVS